MRRPKVAKLGLKDFKKDGYARQPSSENDWNIARAQRLKIDGKRCAECGSTKQIEIHHIVPRSRGGSNAMGNLITLCGVCHLRQHKHLIKRKDK